MKFILDNTKDVIQECLEKGSFYEKEELDLLATYISPGWNIIDVGANIGNHAFYFDKNCKPNVVYVIEPLIRAYQLMLINSALNYCHTLNFDYLGIGLGSHEGKYEICQVDENNLGGTILMECPVTHTKEQMDLITKVTATPQTLTVVTGDSIFADKKIDLIKIDVETMEIDVLVGFEKTITKNQPLIFIEIWNKKLSEFQSWLKEHKYKIIKTTSKHENYQNFLIGPI